MHRWWLTALLALLTGLGLTACDDGGATATADAGACTAGAAGCACTPDDTCEAGATCTAGLCVAPRCDAGDEGCACLPGDLCRTGPNGRPMACNAGRCEITACTTGAQGCACGAFDRCDAGLICQAGQCVDPGCEPGQPDCICDAQGACAAGLICDAGRCVDPGCRPGAVDCVCSDGACDEGLLCRGGRCQAPCPAGNLGCACDEGACNDGALCVADRCSACTPGEVGCLCGAGDACAEGARCESGVCAALPCPEGTDGCPCGEGGACGAELACTADGTCAPCPAGERGCACGPQDTCADPAADRCVEGTCAPLACALGEEGCGCGFADGLGGLADQCALNERGEALACADGLCAAASCAPGDTGCACAWGVECALEQDACVAGYCQPKGCAPGLLNCACAAGERCAAGLACRQGSICVDGAGYPGGACLGDGTCRQGAVCDGEWTCQACQAGTAGCTCLEGACAGGLQCADGLCAVDPSPIEARVPPAEPVCYTRCEASFEDADGVFRRCPADKLMGGCTDDRRCVGGSCVAPGEVPAACAAHTDCPYWQLCIQGACYSNCARDLDCSAGYVCADKVCRRPCTRLTAEADCGEGAFCQISDGELGDCRPLAPASPPLPDAPPAQISVGPDALDFDNTRPSAQLALTNPTAVAQRITVRKLSHRLSTADGPGLAAQAPAEGEACDGPCPLFWLNLAALGDDPARVETLTVAVPAGETRYVALSGAGDVDAPRWQGVLEVSGPGLATERITLTYNALPQGLWRGEIFYFGLFGDRDLAPWAALPNPAPGAAPNAYAGTRDDADAVQRIGNALVQRWSAFRRGRIPWAEFEAALASVQTGSWRWESVQAACPRGSVCYPFSVDRAGVRPFTSDQASVPVPSGVVEMPFAATLRQPDPQGQPGLLTGRIDSSTALHYAGFPALSLEFSGDPTSCHREVDGVCLSFVQAMDAQVVLGGRQAAGAGCGRAGYRAVQVPWLVPGFAADSVLDPAAGLRATTECRDETLPFQLGLDPEAERQANLALAAANPIPDGRARRRTLTLVDGALINQSTLFILFQERFDSFLDPADAEGFGSYGMLLLRREPADLDPADADGDQVPDVYQGSAPEDGRAEPQGVLQVSCDPALVAEILDGPEDPASDPDAVALTLLDGVRPSLAGQILDADSLEQPHYLCVDTGLFDGGPENTTPAGLPGLNDNSCGRVNGVCEDGGDALAFVEAVEGDQRDAVQIRCALGTDLSDCGPRFTDDADVRVGCPEGSEVLYFTVDASRLSQQAIADHPCQQTGTCADTLRTWQANRGLVRQLPARWQCADEARVYCSDDRGNLREGKRFFAQDDDAAVFEPLAPAIDRAFRYKTRFRNREGRALGFAPEICAANSDQTPYCYGPAAIEALAARVDCLIDLHLNHDLSAPVAARVARYLDGNFSYVEEPRAELAQPLTHDGFERLHTELLVMLGDDQLTRAFASRFDLAGQNAAAFPGASLEPGGFNLAGQAGHELASLYRAAQTYQAALDRFFTLGPALWAALDGPAVDNFVTLRTVVWYFDRVTRASTQKARAYAEIARRYQGFNRPDLARGVIERAYTAGYLESVVMARMIGRVVAVVAAEDQQQIRSSLEAAQGRYRVALLDMREAYDDISDQATVFGVAPDYIPIPALDSADFRQSNAFEALHRRAVAKAQVAREREAAAIASNRDFDADAARFQSELVDIRNTYEDQLADVCGVFTGDDGVVYPATPAYADRSGATRVYGDPCGTVGNGGLHDAVAEVEQLRLSLRALVVQLENVLRRVDIERQRAQQQCELRFELADYVYRQAGAVRALEDDIQDIRFAMDRADRALGHLNSALNLGLLGVGFAVLAAANEVGNALGEKAVIRKEREIAGIERATARWETEQQCEVLIVDANARMAEILLELRGLELEELRAEVQLNQALGRARGLRNRARRLQQQQAEAQQLAIDAEAARNDPNVRIYRNDAVINADLSFDDAMRAAYEATRIFEYYTSQSFADTERLFFIRLVDRGEDNLLNYLEDLLNAFRDFEQDFGLPDTRVQTLSLRDDILAVPFYGEGGASLSSAERTRLLHAALRDSKWLDGNGYIRLPFSTRLSDLSPITRNHKVLYVEAEIIASDFGDHVGRLYLQQSGTGVIQGTDDALAYYRLPPRLAVLNPFFNGSRFFDPAIYRNYRLRDRPLVNTAWDLVINQADEAVNDDLDLQSLTDIRLFVYYTDFTADL